MELARDSMLMGIEHRRAADALEVTPLRPSLEAAWTRFVEAHPLASPYHTLAWRDAVSAAFGHENHYLCARQGNVVTGVLPLVRLRHFLFGDYMVSLPFVNYGGAVADSAATARALMQGAAAVAKRIGSRHVEFRDTRRHDGYPLRADKVAMELALPDAPKLLWSDFGAKLRAQIRRADKAGVQTTVGGAELLTEFYAVFARNMRDLGTPVYPQRFFSAILSAFPRETRIVICRLHTKAVAAGLLLRYRERMEIPWASSLREYNRYGVNMALYWQSLRHSIESGCEVFDFGRSTVDSGTHRFKQQWGATARPLYWHYWLDDGVRLPRLSPDNPKYRAAIAAWRRLPLFIANRIGPMLVKNLP